ncbi:sporulation protein YpjB [Bacillus sp. JCM 19041]|uniref:sporulation protein YpjB n=1 Tax=Bacillus sp. JCM 19041 TaxID=1460637 RepID=UPI0006CFCFF5
MRRWLMLVILGIAIVLLPKSGYATDANTWIELNQTAGQVLQLTKQERYDEAKRLIGVFADELIEHELTSQEWTMSSLRTLTTAFENAEQALTAVEMSSEERLRRVTAFRLTADSFSNSSYPLWMNVEPSLMEALDAVEGAISVKDSQVLSRELNNFLSIYATVRPALQIHLGNADIAKFDSYNAFLLEQSYSEEQAEKHIDTMRASYQQLFHDDGADNADPMLFWVMLTVGGPVLISLSYVGFKKYQAEKRKVKAKE